MGDRRVPLDKKYLLGDDISTLNQWLDLMEKRPQNIGFEDYTFPTDALRQQFITNIFIYPEKTIKSIIQSFLPPEGTLTSDLWNIRFFFRELKEDPEHAKKLLETSYYQKAVRHIASKGITSMREGIIWIVDLLPTSPRAALDALNAYEKAHLPFLPDGRQLGLYDAQTLIRARYVSTSKEIVASVFNSLKPIDLEHLVEALYHTLNFATKMTKRTHDEGVDIIATREEPGKKEKNLIQCKKTINVVGISEVLQLLGG
ncbi:MAG TPA: restriction endonuclease [Nitrososphaera sp.]|jgi:restriction system protein